MKAILVLDKMPKSCRECPFGEIIKHYPVVRCMRKNYIKVDFSDDTLPKECPLKEMPYNYEDAFKIACELLNGAYIGGVDKDYIFEHMMGKYGFVSNESYEKFILEHIDQMAWWKWKELHGE